MPFREGISVQDELKKWLVRRVECIRGKVDLGKFDPSKAVLNLSLDYYSLRGERSREIWTHGENYWLTSLH